MVNTHYLATQVESFIDNYRYKKNVFLSFETALLDTAGTLRKNAHLFDDEVFVAHADNFFDFSLDGFISARWEKKSSVIKALTFKSEQPEKCGVFEVNEHNVAVGFEEKPEFPKSDICNAAIYRFKKEGMQEACAQLTAKNISLDLIPRFVGRIDCYQYEGLLIDIGTPESLLLARGLAEDG